MKAPIPPSKAAPQIRVSIGLSVLLTGGAGLVSLATGVAISPLRLNRRQHGPQWLDHFF